jgi:hypothetical protein
METMNYELLSEMGIYIQKSRTFIWPLLNLKVTPIETYLKFGEIDTECSRMLIALFHNADESYTRNKKDIANSPYYNFTFTDGEFDIVTFNMYNIRDDYDKVINGEYSKISKNFKVFLSVVEKNKVVLKCLEPETNYKEFARVLGIHESELEGRELLSPPNPESETIFVLPSVRKKIYEEYGLVEEV